MLSHRESDKARHYIELLDTARCNARWQEVPELVRKLRKHSSQRQCLTLTAQTECHIASHLSQNPSASSHTLSDLSPSVTPLLNAIETEKDLQRNFGEDAFQAQVCVGWLHWTIGESNLALSRLSTSLDTTSQRLTRAGGITTRWTHVCIVKAACIRGMALEDAGNVKKAIYDYQSILPYLSSVQSTSSVTPEHRVWAERLLARYCMLSARIVTFNASDPYSILNPTSILEPASILAPFRSWAEFWEARNLGSPDGTASTDAVNSHSRARVWQAYYNILSVLVQHDITNPIFSSRAQQCAELKRSETRYETILLQEVEFPKANQANPEIESWTDQVMANWRALCDPTWEEDDLGNGGQSALGRKVLEILYRAATRSFHSTRILRHLFTVHTALSEFDLAGKALDSYLEILTKGKAREEKSGESELGLDDDATALGTAAAGIKMLCAYGRRKEAERALAIASIIETWLQHLHQATPPKAAPSADDQTEYIIEQRQDPKPSVPAIAIASGYHAIGISQACWARLTFETLSRSDLHARAKAAFRNALEADLEENASIETLYSFASVLAETRDIDPAIATVKQAISVGMKGLIGTVDESMIDPDRRALLLRCWHLLALLLSARQDFATALVSCEAAFEPYGGKSVLYGDMRTLESIRGLGLFERKNILEIKMTQLALAEVVDGPEEAVNASEELLSLYTKLFKCPEKLTSQGLEVPETVSKPASTNGTQRSFRGSILGLPKDPSKSRFGIGTTTSSSVQSLEPSNNTMGAPAISVTAEENNSHQNQDHQHRFIGHHESNKLRKRKSLGSVRRNRAESPSKPTSSAGSHHLSLGLPARHQYNGQTPKDGSTDHFPLNNTTYASDEVGVAISHDMPSMPSTPAPTADPTNPLHNIPSTAQNMDRKNPNPNPICPKPPPSQNIRPQPFTTFSPLSLPEPTFPPEETTRHALTLLTKIWLLIASLYRRASMPSDGQGALSEATAHVQAIETDIAKNIGSSAEAFSSPGTGGLKSCGELWADVLTEQATSHLTLGSMEKASASYEKALGHCLDHAAAIIGLSTILLDKYAASNLSSPLPPSECDGAPTLMPLPTSLSYSPDHQSSSTDPSLLARLAARDRAYGLLSALTKSGKGWDSSEAWFALARAYELGGQVERAQESLWWVVELEGGRGVRGWPGVV